MGTCFSTSAEQKMEEVVCKESDLEVGKLVEVKIQDKSCVVVKDSEGCIHALSGKCTHYGASLAKGSFANGVIRCPWHGACFNAKTGDIEDYPGLDNLQVFETKVEENGEVKVKFTKSQLAEGGKRVKLMGKKDGESKETIIVVGGGGAAQGCIEALREDGLFKGRLIMITKEASLPYDRPKLSKSLTSSADEIRLRNPAFFKQGEVEVMTEVEVVQVNTEEKKVKISTGDEIQFDKLILATGSTPRTIDCEGKELDNIFILRTPQDANKIAAAGKGKKVVVIGSSFIGMEIAAYFSDKASSVTVVGNSSLPFEKSLGPEIGQFLKNLHEQKGVQFVANTSVEKYLGEGKVEEVLLQNGDKLEADVVILGVGVTPNTEFLRESGIELTERGFVNVNSNLETSVPGIYAAGDIAHFPLKCLSDISVSIGHWGLAMTLGRCAGKNAAVGNKEEIKSVPFFWTAQYGKSLRYAGYGGNFDSHVFDGSIDEGSFVVYYCQGDQVVAVATLMKDPLAADFANFMASGKTLKKEDVHTEWNKI